MKKIALVIALALASLNAAQAQSAEGAPNKAHFLMGTGLTFGGDKLITLEYEDGDDVDLRAGGMIEFHAGVDYRVTDEFSLQATVGYHVDRTSARNGGARFERVPMELTAYYQISQQWRIGAGARYVSNPRFKLSGAAGEADVSFDNALGGLIEGEYMLNPRLGLKLRYVREKYEVKGYTGKIDGSHVGMLVNYYF